MMASNDQKYRKKIIIDTDCGIDDAQALILALSKEYEESVDVLAITCVAGNAAIDHVTVNVLKVLDVSTRTDIPVYKGAYKPMLAHNIDASAYHGKDGLGDVSDIAEPDMGLLKKEHAVDFLVRITKEFPGEITMVAIGPLTNLALACQMDPEFCQNLKKVCIMGGNTEAKGNISVCGEFNFFFDPEAAYIVLDELCCPVELFAWEACLKNTLDFSFVSQYMNENTPKSEFIKKISANSLEYQITKRKGPPRDYVTCDPFAVALALHPDIVLKEETVFATVELQGQHTRGQLVIDWHHILEKKQNVSIATEINMEKFRAMLIKSLQ